MSKQNIEESEQLRRLVKQFLDGLSPAFNPRGEIDGFHAVFTLTESIKSENSEEIFKRLTAISDRFVKTSESSGYFKHDYPDCEVYLKGIGDSIELKMVSIVSEDCEDAQEIKVLGESCKSSFMNALESVHLLNK